MNRQASKLAASARVGAGIFALSILMMSPVQAADSSSLSKDASQVGSAVGSTARKVGQEGEKVGLAVGHAAKKGGEAFWHAVKGGKQ